jgi:hypothetical protein
VRVLGSQEVAPDEGVELGEGVADAGRRLGALDVGVAASEAAKRDGDAGGLGLHGGLRQDQAAGCIALAGRAIK